MLLKYCPVGSVVRLVSFKGGHVRGMGHWKGTFVVFEHDGVSCIRDRDGDIRDDVYGDSYYQFEIVSQTNIPNNHARQITLNGVTYKLTPITERKKIEIDGVVYEMEAV